jgi:antitoxin (DNA-binding transcriptional repressor) of toxin-antitoxin stability system
MYHMKRATVRDLRYSFPEVEASLADGEEIEIVKRGKVVARLVPVVKTGVPLIVPDFLARLKETWGARILEPSNAELIASERDRF